MKLEEIIHDISKILMQSDLSLESQKQIMEEVRKQIDLQKKEEQTQKLATGESK